MTDASRPPVGARAEPETKPIPVQAVVRRRHRRQRVLLRLLVSLVVLVALAVVAFVVGDRIFRSDAEAQIERSVSQSLPAGVTGSVHATIGGGSALVQWLHGSFDDVRLTSDGLQVAGAPATATVHLTDLPVHGGRVGFATASFSIGQAAFEHIPQLLKVGASAPRLGAGTVSTTLTRPFLGIPLKVAVTLKPSLTGQTVHLRTTAATLTAGPATIPATAIVQQLLPHGVSLCAAGYLPKGVDVTSLRVQEGKAIVGLAAQDLDLDSLDSAPKGSCA